MKTVKVWDLFVRLFHWSLVVGVIMQLITAETFPTAHVTVGYVLFSLLLLRVAWGFVGSLHARFTDFVYPPREIVAYLKGLMARKPKHYLGHNPAGGAMVCLLLLVMLLTVTAGLKTLGAMGHGPLAHLGTGGVTLAQASGGHDHDDDDGDEAHDHGAHGAAAHFWKEIHETLVGVLLFLVVMHIGGVLVSSLLHKENLILAMITGKKQSREGR